MCKKNAKMSTVVSRNYIVMRYRVMLYFSVDKRTCRDVFPELTHTNHTNYINEQYFIMMTSFSFI